MKWTYRPKLSVALGFMVILSTIAAASLSAGVVQGAAKRTFYIELQRKLETSLQQARAGRLALDTDVTYTSWNQPIPTQGPMTLKAPRGLTGTWDLTAEQVNRLRQGRPLFVTEGQQPDEYRVLLAPTGRTTLEATYVSTAETAGVLQTLRDVQVLSVLTVTLLTMLIATLVIQRLFAPLRSLTGALRGLNPRTPGPPQELPVTAGEFEELISAFNAMVRRTNAVYNAQENFVRDAGHELRTPITSIRGHASYMIRRTSPSDAQRESLGIILRETERMERLVGDLQTLTRTANTEGRVTFSLHELTEEVAESLRETTLQNVTVNVTGDAAHIHGVRDQFTQVMINLLSNAAQAHASVIDVHFTQGKGVVTATVRDNGAGIDPEQKDRVFERFFRTNDSRDRRAGGSGLGLSITQGIITAHEGSVTVDSQLGVGTAFTVTLPAAPPSASTT